MFYQFRELVCSARVRRCFGSYLCRITRCRLGVQDFARGLGGATGHSWVAPTNSCPPAGADWAYDPWQRDWQALCLWTRCDCGEPYPRDVPPPPPAARPPARPRHVNQGCARGAGGWAPLATCPRVSSTAEAHQPLLLRGAARADSWVTWDLAQLRRAAGPEDGRPQRDCTVTSQHVVERSQPGWVAAAYAAAGAGRGAGRTTVPTRAPQTAVCGLRSQGGHPHAQGWSPAAAHLGVGSDSTGKSEKGGASSAFALTARRAGGRHVAWAGLWGDAPAASTPNARVSAVGGTGPR